MDIKTLQQYPLASLYAWRAPLFLGKQGATEDAAERRAIRRKVAEDYIYSSTPHTVLQAEPDFADLL